ncbi:MnhB domain-containing protein [Spirochaeta dissipatitropha]
MTDTLHDAKDLGDQSLIIQVIIEFLYPFMVMLGFFIVLNGRYTPGGGFQGGTILASLFIARYLVFPVDDIDTERMHISQRIFLACILTVPTVVLFTGLVHRYPQFRGEYLVLMDILIGFQVGFDLGMALMHFAFFEGVGKTWRL